MTARFDITAPELPWGRVTIGASAGTGKTWTLAALVARYIADHDVSMGNLLVVTFTRAAAAELRSRIRARLSEAATFCLDPNATDDVGDPLLGYLEGMEHREEAGRRLHRAIQDFDAATIGTIHSFAQQVLTSLGAARYAAAAASLQESTIGLVDEVSTDLLVSAASEPHKFPEQQPALPKLTELRSAAMFMLNNPDVTLIPDAPGDDDQSVAAYELVDLVDRVVAEVHRRQAAANITGYTGLLTTVREALHSDLGHELVANLRNQYRIALVDEFQDTDPVQWEIFSLLFPADCDRASPPRALVTVGDPKQAIYAFRGANVNTYLDATMGTETSSLGVNFRSDGHLVDAVNTLFRGVAFGRGDIAFAEVSASGVSSRLTVRDVEPPALVVRVITAETPGAAALKTQKVVASSGHEFVAADVADRAFQLLEHGRIARKDRPEASDPVRPQDIAILVTAYSQVPLLQQMLQRRGIPSVVARSGNVFDSDAAQQWTWLLHSLARPSDPARARMVALSWFLPQTADDVLQLSEAALGELQAKIAGWADTLEEKGLVAFRRKVWNDGHVVERLLGSADGDRLVTDLEHIAEVLAAEVGDAPIAALGLLSLFNELTLENPDEAGRNDAVARRLESDDNAVQIMTIHVSKGLEFPIVMAPYLWVGRNHTSLMTSFQSDGVRFYDPANNKVWPDKGQATERLNASKVEDIGERLRLAYVALTRAANQVLTWWVPGIWNGTTLGRLLFARHDGVVDIETMIGVSNPKPPISQADTMAALAPLEELSGGAIRGEIVDASVLTARQLAKMIEAPPVPLGVAPFTRSFDTRWRRWSFTSMTAGLYEQHHRHDDSMGDSGADDEPVVGEADIELPVIDADADAGQARLPLAFVGAGAAFGTLVHHILEVVDFARPDLRVEVSRAIAEQPTSALDLADPAVLAEGLALAIETPLGPLFDDRPLQSLGRQNRLDEMTFDMPLAGGANPTGSGAATIIDIGHLLLDHDAQHQDLGSLRGWAEALAEGAVQANLKGFLTGSIDGVFRVQGATEPRYVVVDYKTNLLGEPHRPLTIDDYHPDRVAEAMTEHHYPLQALLYAAALHRYLRLRQPNYDPHTHLGGIAYLFVRGMIGGDTPMVDGVPHGVFSWRPDASLIVGLSDLLHRGRVAV